MQVWLINFYWGHQIRATFYTSSSASCALAPFSPHAGWHRRASWVRVAKSTRESSPLVFVNLNLTTDYSLRRTPVSVQSFLPTSREKAEGGQTVATIIKLKTVEIQLLTIKPSKLTYNGGHHQRETNADVVIGLNKPEQCEASYLK